MSYHPGPNYSKLHFEGFPAFLISILVVLAVGSVFRPAGYILLLIGIATFALALVPILRRSRRRDDKLEQQMFGGHVFDDQDDKPNGSRTAR